ncbi:MAG: F420-0--gamma-glutamyl ligase [Clostridia bacterium]|nr:F420-0--gamma-glutamyl ligase [Clostridia bacterium]
MENSKFIPNEGKNINIETADFGSYSRFPVKTHVIMSDEKIKDVLDKYVVGHVEKDDYMFISEKVIAITQGRAFNIDDINPRPLAKLLCKFVYKSPYGIGLGSPWTMELALRDVGTARMLLAAFCSAVTKPFGVRGVFYKVAGTKARAIDGPCDCTIPPYNHFAKMAPAEPDKVARELSDYLGCKVVVIDANDIGVEVLGRSSEEISIDFCKQVFKDNPLGQSDQSTPIAIVRKV